MRLAKTSYGPMNPQVREGFAGNRASWGRYDVTDGRTVYGASPAAACYAEALASQRPAFSHSGPLLKDLFDDVDGDTSLFEAVEAEWAERQHMPPGTVAAGWRTERLLFELTLPSAGWFVDIETADSLSAVADFLGPSLADFGLDSLTVSSLRGEDRSLTTRIAEWVRAAVLDDGSKAHGITFGSKHGSDMTCWAVWLRVLDDGGLLADEPTTSDSGTEILDANHNPPLDRVATLFKLKTY